MIEFYHYQILSVVVKFDLLVVVVGFHGLKIILVLRSDKTIKIDKPVKSDKTVKINKAVKDDKIVKIDKPLNDLVRGIAEGPTAYTPCSYSGQLRRHWSARGISRKRNQQTTLHRLTASRPSFGIKSARVREHKNVI